jgi:CheY-like chemotaxis protein
MHSAAPFDILLVEPTSLLRRTVALTLRSLGTAEVIEAATYQTAHQACDRRRFDGAVIALAWPEPDDAYRGLTLIQRIRSGESACPASMPIAVLVESCNNELLQVLRSCGISRILIKPFRVRDVIETIETMKEQARRAPAD